MCGYEEHSDLGWRKGAGHLHSVLGGAGPTVPTALPTVERERMMS